MRKGLYLTKDGHEAVVAQVVSTPLGWAIRGAIRENGVLCMHAWTIEGGSHSGQPYFDLDRPILEIDAPHAEPFAL